MVTKRFDVRKKAYNFINTSMPSISRENYMSKARKVYLNLHMYLLQYSTPNILHPFLFRSHKNLRGFPFWNLKSFSIGTWMNGCSEYICIVPTNTIDLAEKFDGVIINDNRVHWDRATITKQLSKSKYKR